MVGAFVDFTFGAFALEVGNSVNFFDGTCIVGDFVAFLVAPAAFSEFDSSVDVHIRLGIDPRKADQALRGTVNLPNGTGKNKTVLEINYTK